jgi:prephenate dehydrogenase
MKPLFKKISILGLGLIGGSIALDLKRRGLAKEVVGYNRSAKSRRIALKRKACDAVFSDPRKAVQDADLIILATPVRNIPLLAKQIAPYLKEGACVTDVGSTKEKLVKQVQKVLPKQVIFVGGHPIAGTEQSGIESAVTGLFKDRWWILTPHQQNISSKRSLARLLKLFRSLGAKTAVMSSREHDEILGAISHLPHLVAFSLMNTVISFSKGKPLVYAGRSFRDVTRITASPSSMWTDIFLDNREVLLSWLTKYEKVLRDLKKSLAAGDGKKLFIYFERAAKIRRRM